MLLYNSSHHRTYMQMLKNITASYHQYIYAQINLALPQTKARKVIEGASKEVETHRNNVQKLFHEEFKNHMLYDTNRTVYQFIFNNLAVDLPILQKKQVHLQIGRYELINLTTASEDEVKNKHTLKDKHVVLELIMKKLLDAADYILVRDEYHLDKGCIFIRKESLTEVYSKTVQSFN
ncbi:hypothetical protein BD769DRAFT_1705111 [Suillus cothurnatus]|nr:hypothetical protein BD769DRAFT_1705111 [Suillus cothurnatus]